MRLPESGQSVSVGKSRAGRDILLECWGSGSMPVLLIGGVHGDESEGFLFAERFVRELRSGSIRIPDGVRLYAAPRLNPDGCEDLRRTNHHNVDLNRNMPTVDWTGEFRNPRYYPGPSAGSEPESRATLDMIEAVDPVLIVSLHSYEKPMINYNGPTKDLAEAMSKKNGLRPEGDIGYPTPGSLGTWGGWERHLPVITLEILRGQEPDTVWITHRDAVLEAVGYYLNHPRPVRKNPGE